MRLYCVQVDITEAATGYRYPVVRHQFMGKTREEAWHYHQSHRATDKFMRECEDKGAFAGSVQCRTTYSEGWVEV